MIIILCNKTGARQYTQAFFKVYLLKFTLVTPFLHTFFFSLLLLGSQPGSLMHYLGLLEFLVGICMSICMSIWFSRLNFTRERDSSLVPIK